MNKVKIIHFSDILCVWAYVAQIRIDELKNNFQDTIDFEYRFVSIFGSAKQKLETAWKEKGGLQGYSKHVQKVVKGFPHVPIHPEIWQSKIPESSLSSHIFLCAVRLLVEQEGIEKNLFEKTLWEFRKAFFEKQVNISEESEQVHIVQELGLPAEKILQLIRKGEAHAALAYDFELAKNHEVHISPSLILNEGRQKIQGNVGYLVIEANVKELMKSSDEKPASWC